MTSLENCNANHILLYLTFFFHTVISTTMSRKKHIRINIHLDIAMIFFQDTYADCLKKMLF